VNNARNPVPKKMEIACDHLGYFSSDVSVAELRALLD
jgi:hypothetical protein